MNPATAHFLIQRLTAVLLIPTGLWFVFAIKTLNVHNPDIVIQWLRKPHAFLLMALFLGCLFYHAHLGLKTIIEDYGSTSTAKALWIKCSQLTCGLFFMAGFLFLGSIQ